MQILRECAGAVRIGISGHIRPDGDCVGSCLALYQYLKKAMPQAEVKVFLQKPSHIFQELRGFDQIESTFPVQEKFDVFFALDCNEERLGEAWAYFAQAGKRINIDHHISNADGCGDCNYIRPEVGSTSELIYELILSEGQEDLLDAEIAKAIYVGIIHDTGVFQYSNTRPRTMEIGAALIAYGFPFTKLVEETFYQKTYAQQKICAYAVEKSSLILDGKGIVSCITAEDMENFGVNHQDLEGIVNQLRNTKGVHCAVFLYETAQGEYKVSLRSDEKVDVAKVAAVFGGGGHVRAAGCTMKASCEKCIENLLPQLAAQLEDCENA